MLNSLDKSAEGRVYTWLMQAFNATTPEAIADLAASSGDFPKLAQDCKKECSCRPGWNNPKVGYQP